jgi:hypothetical protein
MQHRCDVSNNKAELVDLYLQEKIFKDAIAMEEYSVAIKI